MQLERGQFKFVATSESESKNFLQIKKQGENYETIDIFVQKYPNITEKELEECYIKYRKKEMTYKEMVNDYVFLSNDMKFIHFTPPVFVMEDNIRASIYFIKKAIECLQFARFFTMKAALLLDIDYNIRWAQGYFPQFLFRCIYFGTATTWYSNAFDHVLQTVYWGKELYMSVSDRKGNYYEEGWDVKKIIECCTYEFVVGELKKRDEFKLRKLLTECSTKIEEVRKWSNYIKHKGGVDYKYLNPENPFEWYFVPEANDSANGAMSGVSIQVPNEKYKIEDFKSPIEIDIDENLTKLVSVHKAIYECIEKLIDYIDFSQYSLIRGENT